jgi:hypothetical protein
VYIIKQRNPRATVPFLYQFAFLGPLAYAKYQNNLSSIVLKKNLFNLLFQQQKKLVFFFIGYTL